MVYLYTYLPQIYGLYRFCNMRMIFFVDMVLAESV